MIIKIRVHTNSKRVKVIKGDVWDIYLKNEAKNGKANEELLKLLREFGKPKIIRGFKSRNKIVQII